MGTATKSHNPYFNRWFSAIHIFYKVFITIIVVTILILIDGFLQYGIYEPIKTVDNVTILILIDGFLQYIRSF